MTEVTVQLPANGMSHLNSGSRGCGGRACPKDTGYHLRGGPMPPLPRSHSYADDMGEPLTHAH